MLIAALFVWLVLIPLAAYQVVLNRRLKRLAAERAADAADMPPDGSSKPRFGHLLPGAAHGKLPARSDVRYATFKEEQ
jgi:hypothetical protein